MTVTIESRDNPRIKRMMKLAKDPGFRREESALVAEGEVMLDEALRAGCAVGEVFVDRAKGLSPRLAAALPGETKVVLTNDRIIRALTSVETPQGVVFCCQIPKAPGALPDEGGFLVLDEVRDPGNVGAILRSADAFASPLVVLTGRCADPWSPKVIRATMGAAFRVGVLPMERAELVRNLREKGVPLYASALAADARDVRTVDLSRAAVVVGNEAAGVSEELLDLAGGTVKIPMPGAAESLNASVAASILLWEMKRGVL